MDQGGHIYFLASKSKRLYTGVTSDLRHRIMEHKLKVHPESFTARYNIDQLVYCESFHRIEEAITRESAIKKLNRVKKIQLIVSTNPTWQDLADGWDKPPKPFNEKNLKPPTTF